MNAVWVLLDETLRRATCFIGAIEREQRRDLERVTLFLERALWVRRGDLLDESERARGIAVRQLLPRGRQYARDIDPHRRRLHARRLDRGLHPPCAEGTVRRQRLEARLRLVLCDRDLV